MDWMDTVINMCTHTHTHRNSIQPYKEWNNAICSNIDEPRDYETKWNKSAEKDKYHMRSLICGILKINRNELIYNTETDSQT